jgi:DNA-binding NtrC family response regulator
MCLAVGHIGEARPGKPTMKNFKILVVDDDDGVAAFIEKQLEREGYEVKKVDGSEQVYSTFLRFRPDLVILDLVIGEEAGLNLINYIRNFAPNMRTIYISRERERYRSVLEKERKSHRAEFLQRQFVSTDLMKLVYEQEQR